MANEPHSNAPQRPQRWLWLIAGIIVFTLVMELRTRVEATWLRAVCGGVAAGALALGLLQFKTKST